MCVLHHMITPIFFLSTQHHASVLRIQNYLSYQTTSQCPSPSLSISPFYSPFPGGFNYIVFTRLITRSIHCCPPRRKLHSNWCSWRIILHHAFKPACFVSQIPLFLPNLSPISLTTLPPLIFIFMPSAFKAPCNFPAPWALPPHI